MAIVVGDGFLVYEGIEEMEYLGYRVIVVRPTVHTVLRTFRERWLTWPWHPMVKTRTHVSPALCPPDKCFLDEKNNVMYCGEVFYSELKKTIAQREMKNYSIGGEYVPRP